MNELKELAEGIDELTGKDGPLHRLIDEVRNSNRLALRNVRLQIVSLSVLALCLICLLVLSLFFYLGLAKLIRSESHLELLSVGIQNTENTIDSVKEELHEAPKIISDNAGKLRVVATVSADETLSNPGNPAVFGATSPSKVEIPLNIADATESK